MDTIGIVGFGRFGKVLAQILSTTYNIVIHDPQFQGNEFPHKTIEEVVSYKIVFIAVPIREFEKTIISLSRFKMYNTTIIDVCSVKMFPVEVMIKYLPENVGIIASHPMFGPDSYSPFRELKMVMSPIRDIYSKYNELVATFTNHSISIVEMTPEEHDRDAAMSQGITHFMGRALKESGVSSTKINTLGFNELLGVIEQTCNDSWDLFMDLQNYNPFTNEMVKKLEHGIEVVRAQIGNKE
jgi:prephenate dehydrogenase